MAKSTMFDAVRRHAVSFCFIVAALVVTGCGGSVDIDQTGTPDNMFDSDSGHSGAAGMGMGSDAAAIPIDGGAGSPGSGGSSGNGGDAGEARASNTGGSLNSAGAGGEAGDAGNDGGVPDQVITVSYSFRRLPAETVCPNDWKLIGFAFRIKNESENDIELRTIRLHHRGTGSTSDFFQIWLNCTTTVHGDVDASSNTVTFSFQDAIGVGLGFEAKMERYFVVYVSYQDATVGSTHEWRMEGPEDIEFEQGIIEGDFPLMGKEFTIANCSDQDAGAADSGPDSGADASDATVALTLKVELAADTPTSYIVVPTPDTVWPSFSEYMVSNTGGEPITITSVTIRQTEANASMADFRKIGLWDMRDNNLYGPMNSTTSVQGDIYTLSNLENSDSGELVINGSETARLRVVGIVGTPESSIIPGDVPRSGHTPALEIETVLANGGAMQADVIPHTAPFLVLRKSRPTITQIPIANPYLVNTDIDIYKWMVIPDTPGPVAWTQIAFKCTSTTNLGLSNFRLRKGATDLDAATVGIYGWIPGSVNPMVPDDAVYHDLHYGTLTGASNYAINVKMRDGVEETVSGNGTCYSLHATISGAGPGSSLTCIPMRDADDYVVTGAPGVLTSPGVMYQFALHAQGDPLPEWKYSNFVWSDLSELPHSPVTSGAASIDWTNGYLVTGTMYDQELTY